MPPFQKPVIKPEDMIERNTIHYVGKTDKSVFEACEHHQWPQILWIGCSDSRVSEECIKMPPGSVFTHRNVANQVQDNDKSAMAVIEYAVKYLEVEHIFIVGNQ